MNELMVGQTSVIGADGALVIALSAAMLGLLGPAAFSQKVAERAPRWLIELLAPSSLFVGAYIVAFGVNAGGSGNGFSGGVTLVAAVLMTIILSAISVAVLFPKVSETPARVLSCGFMVIIGVVGACAAFGMADDFNLTAGEAAGGSLLVALVAVGTMVVAWLLGWASRGLSGAGQNR